MPLSLRPYQERGVAEIRAAFNRGARRVPFVLPTGGGKTTVFSYITSAAAERGNRVCVLVHRQELVDQVSGSLAAMGVPHGIVAGGYPETPEPVQVATVASLVRRLDRVQPFDLLIPDEAHHAVAGSWRAVLDAMPRAFVLGVTATPERLDGRGLGDAFEVMVAGPSVADLTAGGFLVPAVVYAPPDSVDLSKLHMRGGDYAAGEMAEVMSDKAVVGNAIEHYGRLCREVPAVAFCAGIDHSRAVAARFNAAGFRAAHVDGDTEKEERRRLIAALGTGDLDVLTNAGLISEGVDVPATGAAILLRPTQSLGLYLQQVGRALRPAPGKREAIILDHAGNNLAHGLPAEARTWSLDDKPRRQREGRPAKPRCCPACRTVNPPGAPTCKGCGASLRPEPEEQREIDAELERVAQAEMGQKLRTMRYSDVVAWTDTEDKLRQAAKVRGFRRGWVQHRLSKMRQGAEV